MKNLSHPIGLILTELQYHIEIPLKRFWNSWGIHLKYAEKAPDLNSADRVVQ